MPEPVIYTVKSEETGRRIDAVITETCCDRLSGGSRSYVQKLIQEQRVFVNESLVKSNYRVRAGDVISILPVESKELEVCPENIPLDIIYEDEDIIVINKARGMVVHPAEGNYTGTLVNALLYHCTDLSDINGVRRPGIVHRIDKDTTGLLVVAKNNRAHTSLAEQIKEHAVRRIYTALAEGRIGEDAGVIDAPVGRHPTDRKKMAVNTKNGKPAVTHFRVLRRYRNCTLTECSLETGRTHQIRVHMAYIGHPLVGDPVYGRRDGRGLAGQALHAGKLILTHPRTGMEMTFTAPLPADFKNLINMLE